MRHLSNLVPVLCSLALGCGGAGYATGGARHTESEAAPAYSGRPPSDSYAEADSARPPHEAGESAVRPPAPTAGPSFASGGEGSSTSVTTTTTVTVRVDIPDLPPVETPAEVPTAMSQPLLTAATVADHDRRGNYLGYLSRHAHQSRRYGLDMTRRVRVEVRDAQGTPVPSAQVRLINVQGAALDGMTHGDGMVDLFPSLSGAIQGQTQVQVSYQGETVNAVLNLGDDDFVRVRLEQQHARAVRVLDLAFVVDVTGSMEDELRYINQEVVALVDRVRADSPEIVVRVGAVFYRDRTDSVPLQRIAFTQDAQAFAEAMLTVRASGGGDYPEDMMSGLSVAMEGLEWSAEAARVVVLVADAPPKEYAVAFDHHVAIRTAVARGIRILPVAASGADDNVEFLFRAMGAATSSPYVYLTDDSGIGNGHREADTDRVAVEYFNDALARLLSSELRGLGMHEPLVM